MAAEYSPYDGMYEERYAALNQYGNIEFKNKNLVCLLNPVFWWHELIINGTESIKQRPPKDDAKILRNLYLEVSVPQSIITFTSAAENETLCMRKL